MKKVERWIGADNMKLLKRAVDRTRIYRRRKIHMRKIWATALIKIADISVECQAKEYWGNWLGKEEGCHVQVGLKQ